MTSHDLFDFYEVKNECDFLREEIYRFYYEDLLKKYDQIDVAKALQHFLSLPVNYRHTHSKSKEMPRSSFSIIEDCIFVAIKIREQKDRK